jgi:ABC-2 type transport system permease protein
VKGPGRNETIRRSPAELTERQVLDDGAQVVWWLAPTSTPFAVLGIAIGYGMGSDAAFGLLYGLYQVLSALGGLWTPLSILPMGLQTVGKLLPSYRAADLGWRIVGGQGVDPASVLMLIGWALVRALLAVYFSTRAARSR